ncbi:MAG: hypothetical protein ACYCPO_14150, partial [Acidobacteriaceae bacterium]
SDFLPPKSSEINRATKADAAADNFARGSKIGIFPPISRLYPQCFRAISMEFGRLARKNIWKIQIFRASALILWHPITVKE